MNDENLQIKTHQALAFSALKVLDDIAKKHDITYFLVAGSVLGAVRHGGFIPWDDDIDVGMLMDEYKRFCAICYKDLPGGYFFSHYVTNELHPRFFGKITFEGVSLVDIFPIVKTSEKYLFRRLQWGSLKLLYLAYQFKLKEPFYINLKSAKEAVKLLISRILSLLLTKKLLTKAAERVMELYENKDTSLYINICSIYHMETELIKSKWINELSTISFNGSTFMTFANTDEYLTHLYGDYMTLPPKEQQKPGHEHIKISIKRIEVHN